MEKDEKDKDYYIVDNDDTTFLIIKEPGLDNIEVKKIKDNFTIVFDLNNLCKKLKYENIGKIIEKKNPGNVIIKNSVFETPKELNSLDFKVNLLFISDELYSMSPYLKNVFQNVKATKLILKKIKINSKLQLDNFLDFIISIGCEELFLDDIYIELLIKTDKEDNTYNSLDKYFSFEEGKFYINRGDKIENTNLKKLKMRDCPLFGVTENTFKDLNNYKDISIDIDENSLLNPCIITKFKIKDGYSDICFDLDSYKLNEDDSKDYTEYLDYIFNIIIDNEDNNNFQKLHFRNFDITKYEYITEESLTFIDESQWVLNKEEKERKKIFEGFDKSINDKVKQNLNKLSNIKELIFDNCTNHFIELILKMINPKNDLDLFKVKKCGKEYFEFKNILSLNIRHLILFDTPLKLDKIPTNDEQSGKIKYLTIKISSLEHYCKENNLDYYRTIEIIVGLIKNKNYNQNLCFELNALPIIMTFLATQEYNKDLKGDYKHIIPQYFIFKDYSNVSENGNEDEFCQKGIEERNKLIEQNNAFNLKALNNKTIILKRNSIKNKLENYDYLTSKIVLEKDSKFDFGIDLFNLDEDYKKFFNMNKIDTIILDNCLLSNYTNQKVKDVDIEETIYNLIEGSNCKNYKIDMKTLNEIIFKNKQMEDMTFLLKYLSMNEKSPISSEVNEYLQNLEDFWKKLKNNVRTYIKVLKKCTIVFKNIKERKEFYCWLHILKEAISKKKKVITFKYKDRDLNKILPNKDELKKVLSPYFFKKKDENDEEVCSHVFNYFYESKEENEIFGDFKNRKVDISFGEFKFKVEYDFNDPWDIIMK